MKLYTHVREMGMATKHKKQNRWILYNRLWTLLQQVYIHAYVVKCV